RQPWNTRSAHHARPAHGSRAPGDRGGCPGAVLWRAASGLVPGPFRPQLADQRINARERLEPDAEDDGPPDVEKDHKAPMEWVREDLLRLPEAVEELVDGYPEEQRSDTPDHQQHGQRVPALAVDVGEPRAPVQEGGHCGDQQQGKPKVEERDVTRGQGRVPDGDLMPGGILLAKEGELHAP